MTHPNPIAFTIGGLEVRWYGVLIATGFLLAIILSYKKADSHQIDSDSVLDFAIWMIPFSIIGARLYYVIFSWDLYRYNPITVFDIRSGGLAIHGGLIAGILTAIFFCKAKQINLFNLGDLIFPQVALAQAIGRWGNFFNGEAHGGPTDLPWAILVDGQRVHPTFLYESIWCLILFLLLSYMDKKRSFTGQIFMLYGMLYSAERFFVEGLRTDSLMIGSLRQAQVISAATFCLCLAIYIYRQSKYKGDK